MDPVDIDVFVDGVKLVTGDFRVGSQHTWLRFDFDAEAGRSHTVRAVTKKGGADRSEAVHVPASGRWVVVSFWYDARQGATPEPPSFGIDAHDAAPGFD